MTGTDNDGKNLGPQGGSGPGTDPNYAQSAQAREALMSHGYQEPKKKKRGFNPMGPLPIFGLAILVILSFFMIGPETFLGTGEEESGSQEQRVSQPDQRVLPDNRSNRREQATQLDFDSTVPTEEPEFALLPIEPIDEEPAPSVAPQPTNFLEKDAFEKRMAEFEKLMAGLLASQSKPTGGLTPEQLKEILEENASRMSNELEKQRARAEKERERILAEAAARDEAMRKRLQAAAERVEKEREVAAQRDEALRKRMEAAAERAAKEREAAAARMAAAQLAARERAETERKAAATRIAAAERAASDARAAAAAATAAAKARPAPIAAPNPGASAGAPKGKQAAELEAKKRKSNAVILDFGGNSGGDGANAVANTSLGSDDDRFLSLNADQPVVTVVSKSLPDVSSTLVQGSIISAVLETAISSEMPGALRAQVIEPVFSFDGTRILMPAGTTLIGSYRRNVKVGQTRLLVAWNRAITPKGQSVALGGVGTDTLGRSGMGANVNNRLFQKFGMAAAISFLAIAPELAAAELSEETNTEITLESSEEDPLFGQSVGSAVTEEMAEFLGEYLKAPPLLRVGQGEEIRVFINRDIVFR